MVQECNELLKRRRFPNMYLIFWNVLVQFLVHLAVNEVTVKYKQSMFYAGTFTPKKTIILSVDKSV